MAERHPGWVNGVDAAEARLATGLLAAPDSAPLRSFTGIRPTPGFPGQVAIKAGSSPVTLTVNPFQAVIQDLGQAAGGAYLVTLDTVKELPVGAASANQGRIDLVVALIDSKDGFAVQLVPGTPGNPPSVPGVPSPTSLVLAQVLVPAGGSTQPTVTDQRTLTTALGGILPVFKPEARPQVAYQGMYAHRLDTNNLEYFDGAKWRTAVDPTDTGWVPINLQTNWTAQLDYTPQIRRVGKVVNLRGVAFRNDKTAGNRLIATFPKTFSPSGGDIWRAHGEIGTRPGSNATSMAMSVYSDGASGGAGVVTLEESIANNVLVWLSTTWLVD